MKKMKKITRLESLQVQKELEKKLTEKAMDHELYRFTTMNTDQLLTRLTKIKNPLKAEACRKMAKWCGIPKVAKAAMKRRNELYFEFDF